MRKLLLFACAFGMIAAMQSCQKENSGPAPDGKDAYFGFETTKDFTLSVNYGKSTQVFFEVYEENPFDSNNAIKDGVKPVFGATTKADGTYSEVIDIPSAVAEAYIVTEQYGVPSLVKAQVTNGSITMDLTKLGTKSAPVTRTGTYPADMAILCDWDSYGKPVDAKHQSLPAGMLEALRVALPPSKHVNVNHPEYLQAPVVTNIRLTKATNDVKLVFAHMSASKHTTLGYFTYPTNNPPASVNDVKKIIAFPDASYVNDKGVVLESGDYVQLKYWDGAKLVNDFPAGTSIGFFIIPGSYNATTGNVSKTIDPIYTYLDFNATIQPDPQYRQHNLALGYKVPNTNPQEKVMAITFEDVLRPNCDNDFNDIIFYVEADGIDDEDIHDLPEPPYPPIPDYIINYEGLLIFEDLWPCMGDYDMNDVVIRYKSEVHRRGIDNSVIKTIDTFYPLASYATYGNGFGYQMGSLPTSGLASVTMSTSYPSVSMGTFDVDPGSHIEKGQPAATLLVFSNMHQLLSSMSGGEITITTTFTNSKQTLREISAPPYNPFMISESATGRRDKEVHLPNYAPTPKADWLGRNDDRSDPSKGIYYVSDHSFPFALKIPYAQFLLPKSGVRIDSAYPKFSNWVKTNGAQDADWYKHPDLSKVYIK